MTRTVRAAVAAALAVGALTTTAAPSGAEPCSGEASFDQQADTVIPVYGRAFMLWVDDDLGYVGGGRNMGDADPDSGGYFEVYADGPTVDNNFGPAPAAPLCLTAAALPAPGSVPGPGSLPAPGSIPGPGAVRGEPGEPEGGAPTTTTTTTVPPGTGSTGQAGSADPGDRGPSAVLGTQVSRSSGTGLARTGGDVTDTVALGASLLAMGTALVLLARSRRART